MTCGYEWAVIEEARRRARRRRLRAGFLALAFAGLLCLGMIAFRGWGPVPTGSLAVLPLKQARTAPGRSRESAVPVVQAASSLAAVFEAPPGPARPSARALREGSAPDDAAWRRLRWVESEANLVEFDVARERDGGVCMFEIDHGDPHPGASTCFPSLRPGGDLQSIVGKSIGDAKLLVGLVPDSVVSVTIRSAEGTFPARVDDNVVTWRAPASNPGLEPTGAVISLRDGRAITADATLAVK